MADAPRAPRPFDASDVLPGVMPFIDPHDHLVPADSYLQDFVLATKGIATPTRLCVWGALFQVSCVLKRDAWISWSPDPFYGNLYVIFVGPPRWQGKSTVIDGYVDHILRSYTKHLPVELQPRKQIQAFHSKVTPEGLFKCLSEPTRIAAKSPEGKSIMIEIPWSNAALIMSELGTFLSKQRYNESLVQKITDLYSCKAEDDETTKGEGKLRVRDTYVTLLGATTQEAIEKNLPDATMADGFLSRVIIVRGDDIVRVWSKPYEVVDKGRERLGRRLAWIAAYCNGEYTLDDSVNAAHDETFMRLVEWTRGHPDRRIAAAQSRKDLHVLKVAMLICASRYDTSRVITLEDYHAAVAIVDDAYKDAFQVTAFVGSTPESKAINDLRSYLEYKHEIERRELIGRFSAKHGKTGIPARTLTLYLRDLVDEGMIEVWDDNRRQERLLEKTHELYRWVGKADG